MGTSLIQKIVKNEAMKQDPPKSMDGGSTLSPVPPASVVSSLVSTPVLYDLVDISPVDRANLSANIVSTLQAGCFVGALLAAQAADRFGRRPVLIWAAGGISVIGVILQAAASGHLAAMYVGRFISGFGTGFASMVNPLYVAENAPRAIRGGLTGIYQLFIVFGIFLSYWINFACIQHVSGTARYMIPLVIQGIPPLLLMISMFLCNESPRHLAKQDKWEEALKVLSGIRSLPPDHPYVAAEFADIRTAIEEENAILDGATWMSLQREMWLVPSNRKRAIISILLMFFQQMTGTNAINYYAPQIFESLGVKGTQNELFATGIYGLVKLIAVAVFLVFVADSLGRRKSLLWTGIGQGSTMLYIGIFIAVARPQDQEGGQVSAAGYVALICVFLFACMFQFGWGPCCWIYVSEIATTRLRATNVSFAAATQWLFNFVISRAVPPMLETLGTGGYGTYIFFCIWCFSMTIFVWFFIPETKGISLEGMNELFGFNDDVQNKRVDIESSSVNNEKAQGNVTQLEDTTTVPPKA
ncbi:MFS quinate transporter [Colletotrichum tofieldiae]|nr:MFS quinate transporter [Colletotrichum tofieldiae]